jgi:hypothetical protein
VLKRILKKGKIVEVVWEDASNVSGWGHLGRKFTPIVCYTVGYVVYQTSKLIAIAQSHSVDDGKVSHTAEVMVLPRMYIRKCRYL